MSCPGFSHSKLYTENQSEPWEILATEYLGRLEKAKASSPSIPYSYANIQPGNTREEEKPAKGAYKSPVQKSVSMKVLQKIARGLQSRDKIIGVVKLASWQLKQSCHIAQSILINQGESPNSIRRTLNAFAS